MSESGKPIKKSKIRSPAHKFLAWAPPSALTGLLAVTALGGESVRAKIWDAIVATFTDQVALPVVTGVALIWAVAWWATRDRNEERPAERADHGMPSIEEIRSLIAPQRPFGEAVLDSISETAPPPARRKTELDYMIEAKGRMAVEAALRPKFDMSLRDVLERIAFDSEWAVTRNFSSPRDHWQETMWEVPLGKEMMRPLASGDFVSRGIRSSKGGDEHGHSDIPASFWLNPELDPHADRLLLEPGYDFVMNFAEGFAYHDIRLCSADVNREWPARSAAEIEANPAPFVAWAKEWKECYDERMVNAELEYDRLRALAQVDRIIPFIELRTIAPEYGLSLESNDSPTANLAYEIEGALREAAARGKLAVEGRQYRGPVKSNDPLLPISPDHFRDYEFRHGRLHYDAPNEVTGTGTLQLLGAGVDGVENVTFYDLHLSERGARAVLAKIAQKRNTAAPADAGQAERRRALICAGRDLVHRYNTDPDLGDFQNFVRQERAYLDIQPHLGAEYSEEAARNSRTIHLTADGSSHEANRFLEELGRLEREWRLV